MASERSLQHLPEGSQEDESGLHESSDPLTVTDWYAGIVVNECEVSVKSINLSSIIYKIQDAFQHSSAMRIRIAGKEVLKANSQP